MKLTKNEFRVLKLLKEKKPDNQREIAEKLDLSVGTVNRYIRELKEKEYIREDYRVSAKGTRALEPYRAKKAIIMAAGFGSRMVPVTLVTPKPLVKVNGTRIIDTIIDALLEKGIEDITIVRGYLKHKFNELLVKYPMLKFVDNDLYNEANNIYSMYLVKDRLQNAYVFDGDLFLYNRDIIENYHYTSNFCAFRTAKSDDWCFDTKGDRILSFVRGGENTWQETPISYWSREDGKRLEEDIERVFYMPGGKELLWENVPLTKCVSHYDIRIRKCVRVDTMEIDTFNELCDLDPSYRNYSGPKLNIEKATVKNICETLNCKESDIHGIEFMKIGLTNVSFKFSVNGVNYVYRKPGDNTKKFINRLSEVYSEDVAKRLGLDNTVEHIDETGWKLSRYVENSTQINPYDIDDQKRAMAFIRKLHEAKIVSPYDFDYIKETKRFVDMFKKEESVDFTPYEEIHQRMVKLDDDLKKKGYGKVLCHNDYWFWNILKDDRGHLTLLDWEYSGNAYPASDVAYFVSSLNYDLNDYLKLAEIYEEHELNEEEKWYYTAVLAIVMWYWFVWALFKESDGKTIEDKQMWYDKAVAALAYSEDRNDL